MIRTLFGLLLFTSFITCKPTQDQDIDDSLQLTVVTRKSISQNTLITKIGIGSCNNQNYPQNIWPVIQEKRPQLWIWLGDNIYADTEDLQLFRSMYDQQLAHQSYKDFIRNIPIIGIWDDHDYGENNSGKYYPGKLGSKTLCMNFLGVPEDAPVRKRAGIYQSFVYGRGQQKLHFILLDTRYFRDDPLQKNGKYLPSEGDILGMKQWDWLEETLRKSDANIFFIASGYQIIPQEHRFEKWDNFPRSRQKLFNIITELDLPAVILLSGDRHAAEISKIQVDDYARPIYEFTSSGFTHSRSKNSDFEPNQFRMGNQWNEINFGILQVDWNSEPVQVVMQIFSKNGHLLEEQMAIF